MCTWTLTKTLLALCMLTVILHKPEYTSYCSNFCILRISFFPPTFPLVGLGITIKFMLFTNLPLSAHDGPKKLFIICTVIQQPKHSFFRVRVLFKKLTCKYKTHSHCTECTTLRQFHCALSHTWWFTSCHISIAISILKALHLATRGLDVHISICLTYWAHVHSAIDRNNSSPC